jgi:hypothetical protein
MRRIKVLLDFFKLSVAVKIEFYRTVIAKLTGNATYPTPDKPIADAKTAVDKLETSFIAAQDGSHTAVSAMHDAELAADVIFRILAAYVDRIAAGDETKILSSGFHPSQQPAAIQKDPLTVVKGANSGSVKLSAKAVDAAVSYIWQMAADALPQTEAGWTVAGYSTRSTYEIAGLPFGSKYYFRVAAVTPNGATDFTAPVLKLIE